VSDSWISSATQKEQLRCDANVSQGALWAQIEIGPGIEVLGRFVHQRDSSSCQLRAAKLGEDYVAAVESNTICTI